MSSKYQSAQSDGPAQDSLGDLYKSIDPVMREYYRMRQEEYRELRNSDDLILRDYWWNI